MSIIVGNVSKLEGIVRAINPVQVLHVVQLVHGGKADIDQVGL